MIKQQQKYTTFFLLVEFYLIPWTKPFERIFLSFNKQYIIINEICININKILLSISHIFQKNNFITIL